LPEIAAKNVQGRRLPGVLPVGVFDELTKVPRLAEQEVDDDFRQAVAQLIGISRLAKRRPRPKLLYALRVPKRQVAIPQFVVKDGMPPLRDGAIENHRQTLIQPKREAEMR
jgi:hypothetical protein